MLLRGHTRTAPRCVFLALPCGDVEWRHLSFPRRAARASLSVVLLRCRAEVGQRSETADRFAKHVKSGTIVYNHRQACQHQRMQAFLTSCAPRDETTIFLPAIFSTSSDSPVKGTVLPNSNNTEDLTPPPPFFPSLFFCLHAGGCLTTTRGTWTLTLLPRRCRSVWRGS